ncbi:MAG: protein kinase [Vicinamibacteria bacterium]|nr:protein kinase [Vicinamibacteria bacterium]
MALSVDSHVGPYQVLGSIGCGGMGEVYRARDLRLSRDVAVKVLRADVSRDSDLVRRFEQEAKAVGALNHPNILTVFDTGESDGLPYIVSELLQGGTLRERLQSGPLEARKAIEYGLQIARGLAAAHERGIVHRDLKPENLFLTKSGVVKILDFGIAKLTHPEEQHATPDANTAAQTTPGTVMGTSGYMSPEQVRGLAADERSDLFSFGAVLFEMLLGRRAFKGATTADTMSAILHTDPTPALASAGGIPGGIIRIVTRCLEKAADDRFQSARELVSALEFTPEDTRTVETRPGAAPESRRALPSFTLPRALALAAVFLGGGALLVWTALQLAPQSTPRYQRLTFQLGDIKGARFAPDGETMVFAAQWGTAPLEIFTTRAVAGGSRPIGVRNALVLAVSSREQLAVMLEPRQFTWNSNEGTLATVPLTGGTPRELLEGVIAADWSPDGKELAVIHAVADRHQIEFPVGHVLYAPPAPIWLGGVRVSPKGDLIAFLEHPQSRDGRGDVKIVDLKGNAKTVASGYSTIDGLAWSRDGREVWFGGQREGGPPRQINAATVDGRNRLVAEPLGSLQFMDLSTTGSALIMRTTLWTEMRARSRGTKDEVELAGADLTFLSDLTDDGKRVLGTDIGVGGGPNFTSFLQTTDGSPAVRLGEGDGQALSPDEKSILLRLRTSPPKLRIEPTGVGEARDLPRGPIVSYGRAVWDRTGKRIIFAGSELNRDSRLYTQEATGEGLPVAFTEEGIRLAALGRPISPDGTLIVGIGGDDVPELYPLAGGEPRVIPNLGFLDTPVAWSQDGRELFVVRYEDTPPRVDRVDILTGRTRPWSGTRPGPLSGLLGEYRILISPDGESYAYNYVRQMSDLYLATGIR